MKIAPDISLDRAVALGRSRLASIVNLEVYEYAPCYLWHDRPLYDEFGEVIRHLQGDTIYLQRDSSTPFRDLFHELGHVVGRKFDLVGHADNGYRGSWEQRSKKMIAEVSGRRHWSEYLNLLALAENDFVANAASEIWAELFMLWHLQPDCPEARLIDDPMNTLGEHPEFRTIRNFAAELGMPRGATGDPTPARV